MHLVTVREDPCARVGQVLSGADVVGVGVGQQDACDVARAAPELAERPIEQLAVLGQSAVDEDEVIVGLDDPRVHVSVGDPVEPGMAFDRLGVPSG